jgi:hypothetical protein
MSDAPGPANDYHAALVALLRHAHRHWTGVELIGAEADPAGTARALYEAPFAVLAHDTAADPCFTYANLTAQRLFERDWRDIIGLPSRLSAEAPARAEREALLARVAAHGFIDDYSGIRIARSGRRFRIEHATVWNLIDAHGALLGQAACFSHWHPA